MSEQVEEIELALLAYLLVKRCKRIKKKRRKINILVKEIFQHRETRGAYKKLVAEIRLTDRESFSGENI